MSRYFTPILLGLLGLLGLLALAPLYVGEYGVGLLIGVTGYVVLASAWALFSGPTRYVSLASAAFFGIGAYTVAVLSEALPYPLVLLCALGVGVCVALVVGLSTLRLAGVYFVIFTFGLTELLHQAITWFEVNVTKTLGRYIYLPLEPRHIYWQLLVLAVITLALSWWIGRSRTGLALRIIGDDETVAAHVGINITGTKLVLFALSAGIITLVGAIQAPRWVYIEPSIVFNPTLSFLTLIMALLGGARRLWGPISGAVPLFFLFEWLSVDFPDHSSLLLGLIFIAIVFVLPDGVLHFLDTIRMKYRYRPKAAR